MRASSAAAQGVPMRLVGRERAPAATGAVDRATELMHPHADKTGKPA